MRLSRLLGPLAALCAATSADAHAFQSGADFYEQFVEGAGVVLSYPALLLPTLALGLLIGLWKPQGLPDVWPLFLIGLFIGVVLSPFVGPVVSIALMGLGVLMAALAALLSRHSRAEASGFAMLTGILLTMASFEGHGLFELGLFIHLGIFFSANLTLAISAALVGVAFEKTEADWMRIAVRVAASWIGAILLLMFAFAMTNQT